VRRRLLEQPATILAGGAMVLSGALLLHWMGRLTFWRDEWDFLLHRKGWSLDTFFQPFAEQLLAIPILSYRTLQSTFGMDDPLPFQIVSVALFLLSVAMVFIYMRRRLGEWLALAAVLPILFLGPSWDDLLFPFQMALFGSVSSGVGALLLLERRDRAGDLGAMVLLFLSLFFFDLGIAFVAAATIELAFGRDRWRRAFVVVVPTAIWLLWYAIWGHEAHTFISFSNFAKSPSYMLDGLAASLATWVGLGAEANGSPLDWGRPLLVLALGLVAWRLYVLRSFTPRLIATSVLLLGFWFLVALNTNPFAPATAGRYQYLGIVLMALVVAELAAGLRMRRYAVALIVLAAVMATMTNGVRLRDAAIGLAGIAEQQRGGLGALELARDTVDPGFLLTEQNSGVEYLGWLDAGSYLDAIDEYGSPAYTESELADAPDNARTSADTVSADALDAALQPAGAAGLSRCSTLNPGVAPAELEVPPEGIVLRATRAGTEASLRRFATGGFPVSLGTLEPRAPSLLHITPDRSSRTWTLELAGGGQVAACRPAP
jgi:hypothetical protein